MYKIYTSGFVGLMILLLSSCKAELHRPIAKGSRPSSVAHYTVKNLPGAAKITYVIPDKKTLYVKAVYTIKKGYQREAKASKFDNQITVDGFADTGSYKVQLYAVGRDEKSSDPVEITVHPLIPPYKSVLKDLSLLPDYGGGRVVVSNPARANLMVGVITINDTTGKWQVVDQQFSNSDSSMFIFRGFPHREITFGVFIRDEWQNYSDTIIKKITPYEEIGIDLYDHFQTIVLPGDAPAKSGNPLRSLFDGESGLSKTGYYSENVGLPAYFTLFLGGDTYALSRFRIWMNPKDQFAYTSSQPKRIRIWGSMNPNPNGSLDSTWYVLKTFDDWKPSGLPVGENTAEDLQKAEEGNEFLFEYDTPPVKYIRFEVLQTWSPANHFYLTEMALWGRKQ